MSKVRILVIEDELIIAEDMRMMLEDLGYEVVGTALDYSEAIEFLNTASPDIVLSDIALGGAKDGIDLAREIRETYELPFIFVTSHSDKSTLDRAKSVKPNGYLVKPFEADDLYTSIEIALFNYSQDEEEEIESTVEEPGSVLVRDSIFIKEGHLFVKLQVQDLRWLKSEGNYLELYTDQKRFVIRSSLKDFLNKLTSTTVFRVHKSYAVNLEHVAAINHAAVMVGEESIPMGRNYREQLLAHLNTA